MELIIWILAAYGMTQILVYGSIFDTPRDWIKTNSTFFGDLISCVMCTSTWVGFFFSLTFFSPTIDLVLIPYSNIFFDGILASGSVWALNAFIEWFEKNVPSEEDEGPTVL
mgnify:FL=1|jgi:hypothetical protein|tara:strand:- start:53 stop:385 length:333 start_codon:yes stop_codon:yes gene_type:complete